MKRRLITSSLAALGVAFLLPLGASAATLTNTTTAKHVTAAPAKTTATVKSTTAGKTVEAKEATATKHHRTVAKNASAKAKKIDINTATREELMTLPGIDAPTADKIIEGRPYKNMSQLKSKTIVSSAEYRKISSKITARQSAMHSEAPANGTPSTDSGAQATGSGEGAANANGSSDQTTK